LLIMVAVIPFGRFYPLRADLINATKSEVEGGTGGCEKFWEWTELEVKRYL
jgi:retinol dehydrogenase-12